MIVKKIKMMTKQICNIYIYIKLFLSMVNVSSCGNNHLLQIKTNKRDEMECHVHDVVNTMGHC